ncbi:hypothetical protein ABZU75_09535 [Streptosporangium sp. NPDC005286]|uniref:hypothetical protein n=1 Tax=Streptosporangium sp. NPDC005286 TaxID=3154463 RepID=UPI0033B6D200
MLYLVPLLLGWLVLLCGSFMMALASGSGDGTEMSLVIMVAAFGLAFLLTAVVMAITELTSAIKHSR